MNAGAPKQGVIDATHLTEDEEMVVGVLVRRIEPLIAVEDKDTNYRITSIEAYGDAIQTWYDEYRGEFPKSRLDALQAAALIRAMERAGWVPSKDRNPPPKGYVCRVHGMPARVVTIADKNKGVEYYCSECGWLKPEARLISDKDLRVRTGGGQR